MRYFTQDVEEQKTRTHSTETAVLEIFSDTVNVIGNGKIAIVSLLDLSAVFDTDDHPSYYGDRTFTHPDIYPPGHLPTF